MLLTPTPIPSQLANTLAKLPNCFIFDFHVQTVRRPGLSGQIGLPLLMASNNHGYLFCGNMFCGQMEARQNAGIA